MTSIYNGQPITIAIEASIKVINEQQLNMFNGEHFDTITNVIAITDDNGVIMIESCRSIEAFHRGEANAGRGTWEFPRGTLERIYIQNKRVWGQPVPYGAAN